MKKYFYKPVAFALMLIAFNVFAGVTGKIAGVVIDAETREYLPGAVITVLGTSMCANTDLDGRYTIINVPVGTYTVQAKMLGYESQTFTGIKSIKDLTTTINYKLKLKSLPIIWDTYKILPQDNGGQNENNKIKDAKPGIKKAKFSQTRNIKKDQTQTIYTIPAEEIEHTPAK
jgi:hypothetical protein